MVTFYRPCLCLAAGLAIATAPLFSLAVSAQTEPKRPASPAAGLQTDQRAVNNREDVQRFFSLGNGRDLPEAAYPLESPPCAIADSLTVVCARFGEERLEPEPLPALPKR